MLTLKIPVLLISTTNLAALILQSAPPLGDITGPVERLSLVGAQGLAIYYLWRALGRKDEQMAIKEAAKDAVIAKKDAEYTAMAVKVTETMALVLDAVKELRVSNDRFSDVVKESQRANAKMGEDLGNAIDNLVSNIGVLPCTQQDVERAERADHVRRLGAKKA